MKMFSATLRSGKSVGSWKMIAIPAACDCLALSKITSSPSSSSRPRVGAVDAGEDLHERRLAGAVLADERRAPRRRTARCARPRARARRRSSCRRARATSTGSIGCRRRGAQSRWKISSRSEQPLVGPPALEALEELRHLGLPACVHVGLLHRPPRCVEILALDVADDHAGVRDEERVVAPARRPRAPRASRARPPRAARGTRRSGRGLTWSWKQTRWHRCSSEALEGAARRRRPQHRA